MKQFKDADYEAIRLLAGSAGWALMKWELDDRIKKLEDVLLSPELADMLGTDDPNKQLALLNYKKMERKYLMELKSLPETLLASKIK